MPLPGPYLDGLSPAALPAVYQQFNCSVTMPLLAYIRSRLRRPKRRDRDRATGDGTARSSTNPLVMVPPHASSALRAKHSKSAPEPGRSKPRTPPIVAAAARLPPQALPDAMAAHGGAHAVTTSPTAAPDVGGGQRGAYSVQLQVFGARDLAPQDLNGTADPFVELSVCTPTTPMSRADLVTALRAAALATADVSPCAANHVAAAYSRGKGAAALGRLAGAAVGLAEGGVPTAAAASPQAAVAHPWRRRVCGKTDVVRGSLSPRWAGTASTFDFVVLPTEVRGEPCSPHRHATVPSDIIAVRVSAWRQVILLECWDADALGIRCEHLGAALLLPEWFAVDSSIDACACDAGQRATGCGCARHGAEEAPAVWRAGIAHSWPERDWLPLARVPGRPPVSGALCVGARVAPVARGAGGGHRGSSVVPPATMSGLRTHAAQDSGATAASCAGAGPGAGAGADVVVAVATLSAHASAARRPAHNSEEAASQMPAARDVGGSAKPHTAVVPAPKPPPASATLVVAPHVHTKYCDRDSKVSHRAHR